MPKKSASAKRKSRPYQVFVSHAMADKWIARTICEKIDAIGASTFRDDRDIDGGDDIPERIAAALRSSQEVIVILTPESVNRPWVLLEVGAAWGNRTRKRITPILCHVEFDLIPDMLKSKKGIHINQFDDYLAELASRIKVFHAKT